jgi:L-threonylcarbamoyladenylate synthase
MLSPKNTEILSPDDAGLSAAADILADGGLVAFPTETVYGLGGAAMNGQAVARIYEAKGRPSFNPLIVHCADAAMARDFAGWSDAADNLASAFWPGPLTMVLPLRAESGLSSLVSAGQPSVALRVPAHPLAQALIARFGGPIAAPSANPSGRISPTTSAHVAAGLSGRIAAILDGGPCAVGVESTIIGLTGTPTLLRPGGLPLEAIGAALGAPLSRPPLGAEAAPSSPGQLRSHYAPGAAVLPNVTAPAPGQRLLGFGPVSGAEMNLSPAGDLTEAAANLFAMLHALDDGQSPIAVSPIPDHGLGRAINDRLRRAAAPRE